jgi:fructose-bisphosphate aldolase class II
MENLFTAILNAAKATHTAAAAINTINHSTTIAIVRAAERAGRDVIIQPSTGTVTAYGVQGMLDMINAARNGAGVRVSLHLDHCRDEALARSCVDAGWDSVMVDYSALPYEENVEKTRAMVEYAHARNVTVEGEIGVIAGVEDDIQSEHSTLATFEDTMRFVSETGIDAVAPAIGTAHGFYKTAPKLNFDLVERFGGESIPLVVHGGTGLTADVFLRLIRLGAAKINISTALKKIYLGSSRELLKDEKAAPVEFDTAVRKACEDEMYRYIALFGGVEKTL